MSLMRDRLKNLIRAAKNSIKDYSPAERRVRDATSNEPWPPSSRTMFAICSDLNDATLYDLVLVMLLKRVQDKGQVMHVRKSLQLVEFCLRHGNKRFIEDMKTRRYIFKNLESYRFLVHGQDKGAEVRAKAEYVMEMLADDARLELERTAAKRARSRMTGLGHQMMKRRPSNSIHSFNTVPVSSLVRNRPRSVPPASRNQTATSPSQSSSTVTSGSISLTSQSSDSSDIAPIEQPRKINSDLPVRTRLSDAATIPNRGELPAIPDNPFDPLSSLFESKPRAAFNWAATFDGENIDGNVGRQGKLPGTSAGRRDDMQRLVVNGGAAAAPQQVDGNEMAPAYKPNNNSLPWYHQQSYQAIPQQQRLPTYQRLQPSPFLALPPPNQHPENPFL